ncbi:hypothetical protein NKZ03_30370 [Sinorhizobium meliloti]|uniref:hypothetical protein n=1 Tax=Rhizobium meliloti TaxID=382 RepID=UPI00299E54E6|nr:hypothetical protein [Sinorhizobium meliloti]
MHNLIELQETYKNNGVGAVAVVAEESAAFVGEALDFGTRGGPVPEVEPAGRARRHRHNEHGLMEASFSVEIPKALVVDRDGYIASIGHPNDLHGVLCLMAPGGTSAQAKAAERERIAEDEPKAAKEASKKQIKANLAAAEEIEDLNTALDAIEEGVALDPVNFFPRGSCPPAAP